MVRPPRAGFIKAIANQKAEDYIWGVPESPEFSVMQRLMNEFKVHESDEEQWLSNYKRVAEEAGDPLIRFLLNLIVADEEKHHEIMGRIVTGLKDDLAWSRPEKVAPRRDRRGKRPKELLEMVERFLDVERRGIKEYEKLNKTSERFHQDLFALVCRTMVHDSLKHIGILDFLRLRLREQQASGRKRKS